MEPVMGDCDFMEHVDTQWLELSDNPMDFNSNKDGNQLLTDPNGNSDQTVSTSHTCHRYDGRTGSESPVSIHRSQKSDLSKMASKKDGTGSCLSSFGSVFNRCALDSNYDGKIDMETVVHQGKRNDDDKRVSNRTRSKVARSLAKALFTGDDAAKGSHDIKSDGVPDMIQQSTCDNEMTLEIGELLEANAVEFVNNFLKINVWESELENLPRKCVDQTVGLAAIINGPKTLAQEAGCRSARVWGSAFDWDDTKEDESGGEFFIKNKEVLLGTSSGVEKCGSESQKFTCNESGVSQCLRKLLKRGHIGQFEIKSNMKVDNHKNEQVGSSTCARGDGNFNVKKQRDERRKKGVTAQVKKSPVRIRPHLSNSDTCNISKQTKEMSMKSGQEGYVASRTRSRYVIGEFKVDVLKPKRNYRRHIMKGISTEEEKSSGKEHLEDKISPSTEVKNGKNDGKCRNGIGMAFEISEAEVAESNLAHKTDDINGDLSTDRVTSIQHSLKEVGENRKMHLFGSVRHEVVSQSIEDEYFDPFCRKKLSLKTELDKLCSNEHCKSSSSINDLRQRGNVGDVRVLFCQYFDEDVIKRQKKIISQLGISVSSSISDATHFVADAFVCTRNMLEAIASGKPVVTGLWLESCGRAGCLVEERNYILRDVKIERELGFSMPLSLARATCLPLLEGRRVLVTPHVKPDIDIISSLVKAAHGQVTKRLSRIMSENERLPSDLLVLSCEEDFEDCVPLLEKGIAIYNSNLLVNGIITQKLDYGRYCIFVDRVKKTRSTLWVKKNGDRFLPCKRKKSSISHLNVF